MKIAFVAPWYGENIPGGAENLCRRLAENMTRKGRSPEVLTTTVRDLHSNWGENFYPAGLYQINGVSVRRFYARPLQARKFIRINSRLMAGMPITLEEEVDYMNNAVNSDSLYAFIEEQQEDYLYFFIPYLFGTSLHGTRVAPPRSFLFSCLHDESYARLQVARNMFQNVSGVLCNSNAELELAKRLYGGLPHTPSLVLGVGLDTEVGMDPDGFRKKYEIRDPFILYVGRRDSTKNVPFLVDCFAQYKRDWKNNLKLVSIGSGEVPIPDEIKNDVYDLGYVPEEDKLNAYGAAELLCQPSRMESFSIVIMESWLAGRPVLVHADCPVTREHVTESRGGFWFRTYPEFAESVNRILKQPAEADWLAQNGKQYVLENYTWDRVTDRFIQFTDALVQAIEREPHAN